MTAAPLDEQDRTCAYCGGPVLLADSVTPAHLAELSVLCCSSKCYRDYARARAFERDRPRGLDVHPSEYVRAIRSQFEKLDDYGWTNPEANWVEVFYLLDALPPDLELAARGEAGLTGSANRRTWRRIKKNASRYIRGAQRERWPLWKRLTFPLGPRRSARRRYYEAHAYLDSRDACLRFDP